MDLTAQDLQLIKECLLRNFSVEDLEAAGYLDQQPTQELRKQLAELDYEFFVRFYVGHHFDREPAPLHKETYRAIQTTMTTPGRMNNAVVWPRGFGKTTTVTLGFPLWTICFKMRRFVVIISNTYSQAKQQLTALKDEIEHNERIHEDFGNLTGTKWQEDDITTKNRIKVLALGSRMKIRGRKYLQFRPDLIIVDDPEDLEGVQSDIRRKAQRDWFFRSVMNAGWNDTKVFAVGNFLHFDCLLKHLVDNPMFRARVFKAVTGWADRKDLWDDWKAILTNLLDPEKAKSAHEFFKNNYNEMMLGAVSAWPEAFSYYDLMVMRTTGGEASFSTELQNEPVDPESRLFKSWHYFKMEYRAGANPPGVWLVPCNGSPAVPLSACHFFAFTDPSMGETVKADFSAIVIIALAPTRQLFVVEADVKRRSPSVTITAQNRFGTEYPISKWRIEKNAFQALFATESQRRSMEDDVYLPIEPYNQLANKVLRINSLQPDLENGYLLLAAEGQEELKKELTEWPMGAHDDALDALEGARTLARSWESFEEHEMLTAKVHTFTPDRSPANMEMLPASADKFAKWDRLAEYTLYEATVLEARERAELLGEDPDIAEDAVPVPVEIFIPTIYL